MAHAARRQCELLSSFAAACRRRAFLRLPAWVRGCEVERVSPGVDGVVVGPARLKISGGSSGLTFEY